MRKSAFTLIELLVVIAIIAILAAILFPVFAQAKMAAKKAQAISNLKNLGTGIQLYLADSDDVYPIANIYNPQNDRTLYNRFCPIPAEQAAAFTDARGINALNCFVGNSMRPYLKNEGIYDDPVAVSTTSIYSLSIANGMPYQGIKNNYAYTFNGLLNTYNATAVNGVAGLIVFNLDGNRKTPGASFANPYMGCESTVDRYAPCVYKPGHAACASTDNGSTSFFSRSSGGAGFTMYAGHWPVVFADSHAKTSKFGTGTTGNTDPRITPFTQFNGSNGQTTTSMLRWWSAENPGGCHAYLFRPDLDFSTWDTAVAL